MLKTKEDMHPQSREILQTFLWWGQVCAPTIQTTVKFCDLAELYLHLPLTYHLVFILGKFTNIEALFPVVSKDNR